MIGVHPIAALFPMLPADELSELAESIRTRGLDHPVVLDSEGRVLDGRNRLAACEIAGVAPTFITYEGDDLDDYALRNGITRRHLTTGARAIIAAKAARLNGESQRETAKRYNLYQARIGEASLVLDWAPAEIDAVIAGATPLSVAVEYARAAKADAEELQAKLERLRANAPDLRALVDEGRMTADDAIAALAARLTKERQEEQELQRRRADERRDARALLGRIVDLAAPKGLSNGFVQTWADHLGEPDRELDELMKRADAAVSVLVSLQDRIAEGKQ